MAGGGGLIRRIAGMAGYETFYREAPLEVRPAQLPAALYNAAHTLLARTREGCVFVPIRSMQYLAVLDAEEIIFVDREARHLVELAWRNFRPQARSGLWEPVPYEIHLYLSKARDNLARLQGEFAKALEQIIERTTRARPAAESPETSVLPFPGRDKPVR